MLRHKMAPVVPLKESLNSELVLKFANVEISVSLVVASIIAMSSVFFSFAFVCHVKTIFLNNRHWLIRVNCLIFICVGGGIGCHIQMENSITFFLRKPIKSFRLVID